MAIERKIGSVHDNEAGKTMFLRWRWRCGVSCESCVEGKSLACRRVESLGERSRPATRRNARRNPIFLFRKDRSRPKRPLPSQSQLALMSWPATHGNPPPRLPSLPLADYATPPGAYSHRKEKPLKPTTVHALGITGKLPPWARPYRTERYVQCKAPRSSINVGVLNTQS